MSKAKTLKVRGTAGAVFEMDDGPFLQKKLASGDLVLVEEPKRSRGKTDKPAEGTQEDSGERTDSEQSASGDEAGRES